MRASQPSSHGFTLRKLSLIRGLLSNENVGLLPRVYGRERLPKIRSSTPIRGEHVIQGPEPRSPAEMCCSEAIVEVDFVGRLGLGAAHGNRRVAEFTAKFMGLNGYLIGRTASSRAQVRQQGGFRRSASTPGRNEQRLRLQARIPARFLAKGRLQGERMISALAALRSPLGGLNFPPLPALGGSEFVNRPLSRARFELSAGEFQDWTLEEGSDSESPN